MSDYAIAVEQQSNWLRWSRSQLGSVMWHDVAYDSNLGGETRSGRERLVFEHVLSAGDTYYVSPRFCDLLERAAQTLPDTTLRTDEIPSPVGFVYFHNPVTLPKPTAFQQPHARGMGWVVATSEKRLQVMTFAEPPPGGESCPFWPLTYFGLDPGESIYQRIDDFESKSHGEWQYENPHTGHEIQYLVAFFRMVNQRLVAMRKRPLSRATRRRAEHAGLTVRDHVQVIVLRRYEQAGEGYETDADEGREVAWRWRWVVRGHWRQQWYPSVNEHRPIWIFPFVKGPEDKPMKDDQRRIYAVTR